MVKIRVKKDILNEHLIEKDYNFDEFLEQIDRFSITVDKLHNFFILIDHTTNIPVYLDALKTLKSHLANEDIVVKRMPFKAYAEGYEKGLNTDITPGINSNDYQIENVLTILNTEIKPFHYGIIPPYHNPNTNTIQLNVHGFTPAIWSDYGFQIGKERQAWYVIFKNPLSYPAILNENQIQLILENSKTNPNETKHADDISIVRPAFNPKMVDKILEILQVFFTKEQQPLLQILLKEGNEPNEKLIFMDSGNRLADAFKKLKKSDIITGCNQKELENWILNNFNYRYRSQTTEFKLRYLNDIISSEEDKCKKPILNVVYEKDSGKINITNPKIIKK